MNWASRLMREMGVDGLMIALRDWSISINSTSGRLNVDRGALSNRAWVLQERVLSRRIIHFAATHTYWECGKGVRCEQFTKLEPPPGRQRFVLDPYFPSRLEQSGYSHAIDFVRFLFKKYSQCGLTVESDRDTAIYSLIKRIGHVLETEARYGIISCFLSNLLLWKRTDEEKKAPVDYGDRMVPSWSWMAYSGGIDFISGAGRPLLVPESADLGFADDGKALIAKIRQFENCRVEQRKREYAIFDDTKKVGFLWFDVADQIEFRHCVVVGVSGDEYWKKDLQRTYYILVVREKPGWGGYERLGAGEVEAGYVSRECDAGKVW
ncbi:hypothetical protein EDB81DRAFT_751443 [Dactylonectria macrodidyma]|uniref:Heterokaryon incompatibility domain-containing protein n=1 Tax=Dactylonectria macrodidyma TaxID=307937 RepID=A0A9P9FTN2_9HYPO|nr:hypothetical protein EDB81DRAFT_751443 [Dactylonectria macrodidyma]